MGATDSSFNPKPTMDLIPPEHEAEQTPENILEKFERCSFCSTKLLFSHDLNLNYFQVVGKKTRLYSEYRGSSLRIRNNNYQQCSQA